MNDLYVFVRKKAYKRQHFPTKVAQGRLCVHAEANRCIEQVSRKSNSIVAERLE